MRFASCLFVGVALLLVASVACTSLGRRGAAQPAAQASVLVCEGNGPEVRRLAAKGEVTRRLLDGELTLTEAAACFRSINRDTGAPECFALPPEKDKPEPERLCRQVIRWVAAAPGGGADAVRRLEAELDERLSRDGAVVLPDAP